MVTEYTLDVGGELRHARARLVGAFERLAAFVAIADRLGKLPEDIDLPSADVVMRFGGPPAGDLGHSHEAELAEVRDNFAAYCARFAVVGMITASEEFLQRLLFLARLGEAFARSGTKLTGHDFNTIREKTRKEVRRLSVDALPLIILAAVRRDDRTLPQLQWFRSIYSIRKCLIHRGGVVGEDDVDQQGVLDVRWRRPAIRIGDEEVTAVPYDVEKDDVMSLQFVDAGYTWKVGDSVTLTVQECQDIALALNLFCARVAELFSEGVAELVKGKAQS